METSLDHAVIHRLITNQLDESAVADQSIAGIIGDGPSHYSKSPALWNAAFHQLRMNAIYLPFDVDEAHVGALLRALQSSRRFMGVNVTVPHKMLVIKYLDALDAEAARIGAVNTIVKDAQGRLTGYNTDGRGFIDSLLLTPPGRRNPFLESLDGMNVLLLGAGGSARAVAFQLSDSIGKGKLIIANRTRSHAESLAGDITKLGRQALAIDESGIPHWATRVGLIVNSSTKGQGGIRKLSDGRSTMLAAYSALAPANPPLLVDTGGAPGDFEKQWREMAQADIVSNNQSSESLVQSIPRATRFYDLVYHPEETLFLRQGRLTGHPTLNGANMIVRQAALAFCNRICLQQLIAMNKNDDETFRAVTEVMFRAW